MPESKNTPENHAAPAASPGSQGELLQPSFAVPVGVVVLGLASLGLGPWLTWTPWLAGTLAVFGVFLAVQTALLRLEFAPDALLVWRQTSLLRRFPYDQWLGWTLFWPGFPVLFYFREQRSIHLLPVLFDASSLRQNLERHLDHPGSP